MAVGKDDPPDLRTVQGRAKQIRLDVDLTTEAFAERLQEAANTIGAETVWRANKVTNVELGIRKLSVDDALAYAHLDPKTRGWTWVLRGVPLANGEDAWTVLARHAKKEKRA